MLAIIGPRHTTGSVSLGRGVAFVREIADYCGIHADVPVFAIGGITPENIGLVKEAGANGGCMMSYMMSI